MSMAEHNIDRRDVLKATGALGTVALAGCSSGGGGDGGTETIVIGSTSTGSSTMQAAQAYARAANEHSESISIDPQQTQGWTQNLYEFASGNIPAMGVDNNSLSKAMNDEGPFADEPVDSLPMQGFIFTSLEIYLVGMESADIQSVQGLRDGGYTIYPIQPGFGTRLLTEEILKEAGMWSQNEILNLDTGDIPGAVEEGRADVLAVYGANGVQLSSWVQEVDVRSGGGLQALQTDEEFVQVIQDHPGAVHQTFEPYGWEQEVTQYTDTVDSWALAGQWAFGPEISADATYAMAELAVNQYDAISASDPTAIDHTPESLTDAVIPEIPIHPGVADYLQDNDAWNDDWTRGEI